MVQLPARRAFVAALVLLVSGVAAGSAVAHDEAPGWWHSHHHGGGATTTTTTAAITTTVAEPPTTAAPEPTTEPEPAPATTTTAAAPSPPPVSDAAAAEAPATPQLDRTVAVAATSGTVNVRPPGQPAQALTTTPLALPTGTRVDTRDGEVALTSATDAHGATQTGRFSGGVFEVRAAANGYTRLVLVGGHWAACKATKNATAARAFYVGGRAVKTKATKKKKPIRSLWGQDDHGRFQTQGSGSVATVRGTRWLTEDSCAGTRTTVTRGAVDVRSRATGQTHRVTAGHSLFAAR